MGLLNEAAEAVVEQAVQFVIDLIRHEIESPSDQEIAMMLASDRLKLRAYAQAQLNARKEEKK